MERLDFILPKWRRMMWSSENARTTWEPRIDSIGEALYRVKLETVRRGLCTAAIVEYPVFELYRLPLQLSKMNLSTIPIGGDGGLVKGIVFAPDSLKEVSAALESNDNKAIGRMLGYPECCVDFFVDEIVAQNFVDHTWVSASNTNKPNDERIIELEETLNNALLSWFGVSPVFHSAHSFDCEATKSISDLHIALARDLGFEEEMGYLEEIASWPVEWSALHGIAEIKTPIFKISTNTDATAHKYVVRFLGSSYPDEGGIGLSFPFSPPRKRFITDSKSSKRFFDSVGVKMLPVVDNSWLYKDNDFNSLDSMAKHHEPIMEAISHVIDDSATAKVIDLGCGNGFLLKRMIESGKNIVPYGIDIKDSRIQNAHRIFPDLKDNFTVGDIESLSWSNNYDVAILMPGRILEMRRDVCNQLLDNLKKYTSYVLLYIYDDWIRKYHSIDELCKKIGINCGEQKWGSQHCQATIVRSDKL